MTKPQTLTADEIVYHTQVLGRVRDAQAVMNSWAEHLSLKYKLGPSDTIDPDGQIVRTNGIPGKEDT